MEHRHFQVFDLAPVGMIRLDAQGVILEANVLGAKILGINRHRPISVDSPLFLQAADGAQETFSTHMKSAFSSREMESCEVRMKCHSGEETLVRMQSVACAGADGAIDLLVALTDLSERELLELDRKLSMRVADFMQRRNQVLEQVAAGATLPRTFEAVIQMIQKQSPGTIGSVLVLDPDGVHMRHGAAPDLPAEFSHAIDGLAIGPCVGSCGTAAYLGQRVIVSDIATDPLWTNFKELALRHGLRSCWSEPLLDSHGKVLGCFAMYRREVSEPGDEDIEIIRVGAQLIGIAVERQRTEEARQIAERERELMERESSELKRIQAALRASEERYVLAEQATNDGVWDWNLMTGEDYMSPRWKGLLGFTGDELTDKDDSFFSRIHPEDLSPTLEAIRSQVEERRSYCVELRLRCKDGSYRWFVSRGQAVRDQAGNVTRMVGAISDITAKKILAEERQSARRRIRELVQRNLDEREQERTAVAREIHDELGQALTLFRIELGWLREYVASRLPAEESALVSGKIAVTEDQLLATVDSMRTIVTRLRPPVLDEFGLSEAIEWQAAEFSRRVGIRCVVKSNFRECPSEATTAVFRIFQETLTNIARHAKASRVEVCLDQDESALRLTVCDNGCGFVVNGQSGSGGFGLLGMRERAAILGGTLHIESVPGTGTEILLNLPISAGV